MDIRAYIDYLARTPISVIVYVMAAATLIRMALHPYLTSTKPHQRGGGFKFLSWTNEAIDAVVYAGIFVFLIIRPFFIQAFLIPTGSMVPTLLVNDYIAANKWVYRFSDPQRFDIVVFRPPAIAVKPDQVDADGQVKVDYIKRLVGVPGDVVEIRDDVLYIDGKPQTEPWKHFLRPRDFMGANFDELSESEHRMNPKFNFKLVVHEGQHWPLTYIDDEVNSDESRTAEPFHVHDPDLMRQLKELPPAPVPKGYLLMMGDNRYGSYDSRAWGLVPRDAVVGRSEFIWMPIGRMGKTR